ncbi:MAG TPA: molybdenum cofactor guanylyltransferase [Syntrophales bacterium]|nr:molybdenum cofactor guanylyltransferase [Syntrophales bacterium]
MEKSGAGTGVILAGGKNIRMGVNKAFLRVGGERLIDRTVRVFRSLFPEVLIVTNSPLEYLDQNATLVTDVYPGKGALGGIYSGLFFSSSPQVFVAACDMPYLDVDFIRYMKDGADDFDIVVPRTPEGLQPLHAIYSQRCLEPIRRSLEADRLKITSFYKGLRIREIPPDVISTFDRRGRMFLNVNSRQELALLQA